MKVLLLPLDDRPVTYLLPKLVAQAAGIDCVIPPRKLMGTLQSPAQPEEIASWMEAEITKENPDVLLLCLDTLLYGGLIPSRRSNETQGVIAKRAEYLRNWSKAGDKHRAIYAQASIMRISDNYDNVEEKEYWAKYGKEIFSWSEKMHLLAEGKELAAQSLAVAEVKIPPAIRQDYLDTRMRNFKVNSLLVDYVEKSIIDYLAFSLDDSGTYGLNVMEKDRLLKLAASRNLQNAINCYAGADEVLCTLIARHLIAAAGVEPKIVVAFSPAEAANCKSRYEGQLIGDTLQQHLNALGLTQAKTPADKANFLVIVHGSAGQQGDHIFSPGGSDMRRVNTEQAVKQTIRALEMVALPCVICDVAYANGADPVLVDALMQRPDLMRKVWAYAGWNTSGNTIGSALALAVASWYANYTAKHGGKQNGKCQEALRSALFVRLADDWAYQTKVRTQLKGPLEPKELHGQMAPYVEKIAQAIEYGPKKIAFRHPWNRTFEIEIDLNGEAQGYAQ
jgi:hypothetical protein